MYSVHDNNGLVKGNFACASYAMEFIENVKYSKEYLSSIESFITRRKIDTKTLTIWDNDGEEINYQSFN